MNFTSRNFCPENIYHKEIKDDLKLSGQQQIPFKMEVCICGNQIGKIRYVKNSETYAKNWYSYILEPSVRYLDIKEIEDNWWIMSLHDCICWKSIDLQFTYLVYRKSKSAHLDVDSCITWFFLKKYLGVQINWQCVCEMM